MDPLLLIGGGIAIYLLATKKDTPEAVGSVIKPQVKPSPTATPEAIREAVEGPTKPTFPFHEQVAALAQSVGVDPYVMRLQAEQQLGQPPGGGYTLGPGQALHYPAEATFKIPGGRVTYKIPETKFVTQVIRAPRGCKRVGSYDKVRLDEGQKVMWIEGYKYICPVRKVKIKGEGAPI